MAKLYFRYGAMGSSKTAQALITKFNYEERNMKVMFIKPEIDTRDGKDIVRSRIGLYAKAIALPADVNVYELYKQNHTDCQVVICDECQFLTPEQVDQLDLITMDFNVPVLCYGLRTDFTTQLFPGSKRLFEIAHSISEVKSVCNCGDKAIVNARLDDNGKVVYSGDQVMLGGNGRYEAMCRKCWLKHKEEQ
jgi:thymidine kinase